MSPRSPKHRPQGGGRDGGRGRGGSRPGAGGRQGSSSGRRGASQGTRAAPSGTDGAQPDRGRSPAARGLGGDQVEGRQAVRELLVAGSRRVHEVFMLAGLDAAPILEDIVELADARKVPVREVTPGRFDAVARTMSAQGVVATAQPLVDHELDELATRKPAPFLLAADGVTDPQNLGALLRSAECAGVTGVVLPRHRAVHVTPAVTKTAAGAIEYLPMSLVGGLPAAISRLREHGVWVLGLDADAPRTIHEVDLAGEGVALVLGAEGKGLSKLVRQRCDELVSIPMRGNLNSLNVSAAGAIACAEIGRHRPG